jgi:hypothetical protein
MESIGGLKMLVKNYQHMLSNTQSEGLSLCCVRSVLICAVIYQSPRYPEFYITERFLIY